MLRDFPRDVFSVMYRDYSDGILTGCELEVNDTRIEIKPGILFYEGVPYILSDSYYIPYQSTGKTSYLKVRFLDSEKHGDMVEYSTRIYIDDIFTDDDNELELARFKLQEGARLRDSYTDYFDFNTEFDTINRLHSKYASKGRSTIYPRLIECYISELMKLSLEDYIDSSFVMTTLGATENIPYELIKGYLNLKSKQSKDYINIEIYKELGELLRNGRTGKKRESSGQRNDRRMLLI